MCVVEMHGNESKKLCGCYAQLGILHACYYLYTTHTHFPDDQPNLTQQNSHQAHALYYTEYTSTILQKQGNSVNQYMNDSQGASSLSRSQMPGCMWWSSVGCCRRPGGMRSVLILRGGNTGPLSSWNSFRLSAQAAGRQPVSTTQHRSSRARPPPPPARKKTCAPTSL